jgi:hypothetical protein
MRDCLVDVSMKGAYDGEGSAQEKSVVSHQDQTKLVGSIVGGTRVRGPVQFLTRCHAFVCMPRSLELGRSLR